MDQQQPISHYLTDNEIGKPPPAAIAILCPPTSTSLEPRARLRDIVFIYCVPAFY